MVLNYYYVSIIWQIYVVTSSAKTWNKVGWWPNKIVMDSVNWRNRIDNQRDVELWVKVFHKLCESGEWQVTDKFRNVQYNLRILWVRFAEAHHPKRISMENSFLSFSMLLIIVCRDPIELTKIYVVEERKMLWGFAYVIYRFWTKKKLLECWRN